MGLRNNRGDAIHRHSMNTSTLAPDSSLAGQTVARVREALELSNDMPFDAACNFIFALTPLGPSTANCL